MIAKNWDFDVSFQAFSNNRVLCYWWLWSSLSCWLRTIFNSFLLFHPNPGHDQVLLFFLHNNSNNWSSLSVQTAKSFVHVLIISHLSHCHLLLLPLHEKLCSTIICLICYCQNYVFCPLLQPCNPFFESLFWLLTVLFTKFTLSVLPLTGLTPCTPA